MIRISPSLLSADFAHLSDAAREIDESGADSLHLDLMDGRYVPNLSFGPMVIEAIRHQMSLPFEAHLMVEEPDSYIERLAPLCSKIWIHPEATLHVHRSLQRIRGAGLRAGVALNPGTPTDQLPYLAPLLDSVLVMSVNPGFGGQEFLPEILPKIEWIAEWRHTQDHPVEIAVDGGVSIENAGLLARRGTDSLIAGSSLFGHADGLPHAVADLRDAAARTTRETIVG